MNERKRDVLEFLCKLVTETSRKLYGDEQAQKQSCGENDFPDRWGFQMNQQVLDFIKEAVEEKLKKVPVVTR